MAEEKMEVSPTGATGMGDMVDSKGDPGADSTDTFGVSGAPGGASQGTSVVLTGSEFEADCYNMKHEDRGKAIIFNNKTFLPSTGMGERTGTDTDMENLFMVLTEMGFNVVIKNDCTTAEMESFMVKVAKEDHSNADCFACAILSHGEEGYVYGKDGPIEIDKLVAPFKGHKCKALANKPKIFFIQACRGSQLDAGVDVADAKGKPAEDDTETDKLEIRRIPTEGDFLMAYSVVPGYYSWRNSAQGSWFVQALVEVLQENWKRMDLLTMMTRVCKKVAYNFESKASREYMKNKKQIPCITSMLTRDVYFAPKK